MAKLKWVLKIEVEVSQNWVADGFDLSERHTELYESIKEMLPYAYDEEMDIKISTISAPEHASIKVIQGY